jgi:hypothetical protein
MLNGIYFPAMDITGWIEALVFRVTSSKDTVSSPTCRSARFRAIAMFLSHLHGMQKELFAAAVLLGSLLKLSMGIKLKFCGRKEGEFDVASSERQQIEPYSAVNSQR